MTRKILSSMMAIALAAMLIGLGTFAYFSDTGTSSGNTFTTGGLTLQLSDIDQVWTDGGVTGTWISPSDWAPGESFTNTLYLKNNGSVDAQVVYEDWTNLTGDTGLSDYIQVIEISDSYPWNGGAAYATNYVDKFVSALDMNNDNMLSLNELASWGDRKAGSSASPKPWDVTISALEEPNDPPAVLPAGGTLGLRFTFKLMDITPNEMQAKTCSIDLKVMASQNVLGI